MAETLSLAVWCAEPAARFDTRKFHFVRRDALHDALEACECIQVLDWGRTDDKFNHEIVDLVIEVSGGSPGDTPASVPALAYIGRVLAKSDASPACVTGVTALISRLEPKQAAGEIAAAHLHLLNNFVIILYPADDAGNKATLRMIAPDDKVTDIVYDATETEIARLS